MKKLLLEIQKDLQCSEDISNRVLDLMKRSYPDFEHTDADTFHFIMVMSYQIITLTDLVNSLNRKVEGMEAKERISA